MAGAGQSKLYTPGILALAVELANYPLEPDLPFIGEARSRTCGSALKLGLALDAGGQVTHVGLQATACAIGQAAAALFARGVAGRDEAGIGEQAQSLEQWLAGAGPQPEWPGIAVLEQARAYPARHGAIVLPWKAAQAALGKGEAAG